MAIVDWKIWKKFGVSPVPQQPIRVNVDIKAVAEYLKGVDYDVRELLKMLVEFDRLRKEGKVLTDAQPRQENLRRQIALFDRILLRYEFYDHDAEINGQRIKGIARHLMQRAHQEGLKKELDRISKEQRWTFDW